MRFADLLLTSAFLFLTTGGLTAGAASAQAPAYTDAAALLDAVAKLYATDTPTFHMEWSTETAQNGDRERSWRKSTYSMVKSDGRRFRMEAQTPMGDWLQLSDGTTEWEYVREANVYVKRAGEAEPTFSQVYGIGAQELRQAWDGRERLEWVLEKAARPELMPDEDIAVGDHTYGCYVVHAQEHGKGFDTDETFWIDKQTLTVRKLVRHEDTEVWLNTVVHLPRHSVSTTVYSVAEPHAVTSDRIFSLSLPPNAKEVASLDPEVAGMAAAPAPPQLTGKLAPDISLPGENGGLIKLSSFRGQPLLIDEWATWCGPCLAWMPTLGRMESDLRSRGVRVISIDLDKQAETAEHYMSIHNFAWLNLHDGDGALAHALGEKRVPLTLLLDKEGRIVYAATDSNEAGLRPAIDTLAAGAVAARGK